MAQPANIGFLGATVDPKVVEAQKWLVGMGFLAQPTSTGASNVDGVMGPITKAAMDQFYMSVAAQVGQSPGPWNNNLDDALKDLRAIAATMGVTLIGTPGALPSPQQQVAAKTAITPSGQPAAATSAAAAAQTGMTPAGNVPVPFYKQPLLWAAVAVAAGGYFVYRQAQKSSSRLPARVAGLGDGDADDAPVTTSRCSRAPDWATGESL